ncbi:hypothetical protein [Pelomonas sp. BJYL3]|uniref:hypothetical protein n=1 Tax=Pelomonas sp. BJYL3 TaxID=2976697 RepID=UPI0022B30B8B|nr:hypothetical protein [Pelomonas sp. BJYL3]
MKYIFCLLLAFCASSCLSAGDADRSAPNVVLREFIRIGNLKGVPSRLFFEDLFGSPVDCGFDPEKSEGSIPSSQECDVEVGRHKYRVSWRAVFYEHRRYSQYSGFRMYFLYKADAPVHLHEMYREMEGWTSILSNHQKKFYRTPCGTSESKPDGMGAWGFSIEIDSIRDGYLCTGTLRGFQFNYGIDMEGDVNGN